MEATSGEGAGFFDGKMPRTGQASHASSPYRTDDSAPLEVRRDDSTAVQLGKMPYAMVPPSGGPAVPPAATWAGHVQQQSEQQEQHDDHGNMCEHQLRGQPSSSQTRMARSLPLPSSFLDQHHTFQNSGPPSSPMRHQSPQLLPLSQGLGQGPQSRRPSPPGQGLGLGKPPAPYVKQEGPYQSHQHQHQQQQMPGSSLNQGFQGGPPAGGNAYALQSPQGSFQAGSTPPPDSFQAGSTPPHSQYIQSSFGRTGGSSPIEPSVLPASAVQQHAAGQYSGSTGRKYFKYHMQRLQTAASHILFYLVDASDVAHLAVVGTDVRGTGHFVYSSIPEFVEAVPLRCTNRMKVMEYLAVLGATDAADPEAVVVPEITPRHLEMLLTSDPMYSKPKLDRQYTSWREEGGKFPDGRHYKQFIVVDDTAGIEKVVVTAEDSHRRDRRYTYTTVAELGGFKLENGNAVKEWLDLMVGRSETMGGPRRDFQREPQEGAMRKHSRAVSQVLAYGAQSESSLMATSEGVAMLKPGWSTMSAANTPTGLQYTPPPSPPMSSALHYGGPIHGDAQPPQLSMVPRYGGPMVPEAAVPMAVQTAGAVQPLGQHQYGTASMPVDVPSSMGHPHGVHQYSGSASMHHAECMHGPAMGGQYSSSMPQDGIMGGTVGRGRGGLYGSREHSPPARGSGAAAAAAAAGASAAAGDAAAAAAAGAASSVHHLGSEGWPQAEHDPSLGELFTYDGSGQYSDSLQWDSAHMPFSHADMHGDMGFGLEVGLDPGSRQLVAALSSPDAAAGQLPSSKHFADVSVLPAGMSLAGVPAAASPGGRTAVTVVAAAAGSTQEEAADQLRHREQAGMDSKMQDRQQQDKEGQPERTASATASATVSATSQDVLDAFMEKPELLEWVSGTPDSCTITKFRNWSRSLGWLISDPSQLPPGAQLPTLEQAHDIMAELSQHAVNLRLLEETRICKTVAMFRNHPDARLAQQADQITTTWRNLANVALEHANAVLASRQSADRAAEGC